MERHKGTGNSSRIKLLDEDLILGGDPKRINTNTIVGKRSEYLTVVGKDLPV